ncbi:hypothetical protein EAS62_27590 [Bradyrhizobium zhanjiangense]|uniref:Uncharacterized protein n=1 Tax=Bradyrhizobium zhanjiangense TaxID=1325107 RepID=A0ABY0DDX2_9BRAD|nr:hypothetical protein EAS62_27590 [Bradyrhizobium zhanjiangense]
MLGVPVACLTHGHAVLVSATRDAFEVRYIVTQPAPDNVISTTVRAWVPDLFSTTLHASIPWD